VRVVALATTQRWHDQVVLYVMYLYRKTIIIYCCEDYIVIVVKTIDCRCDIYVSNLNCHYFAVLSCCICALFWKLPIRVSQIQGLYKKLIYSLVNRGTYIHIFLG
jgi:hypothetical protein